MQRQNYMITAEEVAESMGSFTWICLQAASQTEQRACRSGICDRCGQDTESILGKEILWIFPDCNVKGVRKYGSIQR